ncbi:hypothetical protein [Anatilimnocola floriformis]|uniref:hypothetical protein n=1 Tax=Anatilimnocola floriformis TaxID=2948575 RepID=UPI0020C3E63E|nr:hypothetical protein [Anatilimnocola floriformis]
MTTKLGSMFAVAWLFLAVLLAPASAQPASEAAARLRALGIEPTTEGLQQYLREFTGGELQKTVAKLIADLGAEEFATREKASKALADVVPLPIAALTKATKGDDAERAWRADRLLKLVQPQSDKTLSAALEVITQQKLLVGAPLLIKAYHQLETAESRGEVLAALLATVQESDRAVVVDLTKHADKSKQDLGRVLLARLDKKDLPLDLARSFDAVKVTPGGVAGGGPNLICGWEFKTKADITVTHLALYDRKPYGLAMPHEVAIYDIEENQKPLVLETIPDGEKAPLAGEFRLVPVPRTRLRADRRYAIVAHYADPSDTTVSMVNPGGLVRFHLRCSGSRSA